MEKFIARTFRTRRVNILRLLGNTQAELITTSGAGFAADGSRNPHSWSIVDEPCARSMADPMPRSGARAEMRLPILRVLVLFLACRAVASERRLVLDSWSYDFASPFQTAASLPDPSYTSTSRPCLSVSVRVPVHPLRPGPATLPLWNLIF
jgi:hypothetical protein